MKAYPLHFPEKAPKGTKQGAKLPEVPTQGREIGVFLAFSRVPCSITRIEQDLRRGLLYPFNYAGIISKRMAYYITLILFLQPINLFLTNYYNLITIKTIRLDFCAGPHKGMPTYKI